MTGDTLLQTKQKVPYPDNHEIENIASTKHILWLLTVASALLNIQYNVRLSGFNFA